MSSESLDQFIYLYTYPLLTRINRMINHSMLSNYIVFSLCSTTISDTQEARFLPLYWYFVIPPSSLYICRWIGIFTFTCRFFFDWIWTISDISGQFFEIVRTWSGPFLDCSRSFPPHIWVDEEVFLQLLVY